MGQPVQRPQSTARIGVDDGSPQGAANGDGSRSRATHVDDFRVLREFPETVRGAVALRIRRVDLQLYEVDPVAVSIGEPPGNVSVAAGNHGRRTGKTDTAHVDAVAGT